MRNFKTYILILSIAGLSGCQTLFNSGLNYGSTQAEELADYSYVPIEPSSVNIRCKSTSQNPAPCAASISKLSLLNAFPDNSVRIATRQISGNTEFSVPSIGTEVGTKGNSYEVIIDFVNTQTVNEKFVGFWRVNVPDTVKKLNRCYPVERPVLEKAISDNYEVWTLVAQPAIKNQDLIDNDSTLLLKNFRDMESLTDEYSLIKEMVGSPNGFKARLASERSETDTIFSSWEAQDKTDFKDKLRCKNDQKKLEAKQSVLKTSPQIFNVPVYYGIGLRLKATVTVLKGEVKLTSLPAISASVEAGNAIGTLSVQTIGISGETARTSLLILDKIDTTAVQNAIQVLTTIKASLGKKDTVLTPRIVGFHNTVGAGAQGINLIHSYLVSEDKYLTINNNSYAIGEIAESSQTMP